jgi:hypothetical protein
VSDLTSELQRMADEAARQARPPAAAEILRQGDRRRRRARTHQSLGGLSAAGVVGAGVALGLGLASSAPAHGPSTIKTAAFLLVKNTNGTATLTITANVLLEPGTLQRDLARDGIPAMVTVGSFCSTTPAPASIWQVISIPKLQPRLELPPLSLGSKPTRLPPQSSLASKPRHLPSRTMTINPAAMPAGTELSFGNFRLANGEQTSFTLVDKNSYTCTSTAPSAPPPDGGETSFTNGAS